MTAPTGSRLISARQAHGRQTGAAGAVVRQIEDPVRVGVARRRAAADLADVEELGLALPGRRAWFGRAPDLAASTTGILAVSEPDGGPRSTKTMAIPRYPRDLTETDFVVNYSPTSPPSASGELGWMSGLKDRGSTDSRPL
jgi:hypothetical protein